MQFREQHLLCICQKKKKKKINFRVQFSPNESRKWVSSCSNRPGMQQRLHACLSVYPLCVDKARRSCLPGYKVQAPLSQGCLKWEPPPTTTRGVCGRGGVFIAPGSALCCAFSDSHQHFYTSQRGYRFITGRGRCAVFVLLSYSLCVPDRTTQQSHISQGTAHWGGRDGRFQADIACGDHMPHKALSHVCVSAKQQDLLFDRCCFKRKVFSFCGIGGLSLLLGSQYNYQRLQAELLPGIEWLSQGYYYFPAELFGSQTQHLNNLVYEAYELRKKKKNLSSVSAPHWAVCSGCEQSALGVVTSSASNDKSALFWRLSFEGERVNKRHPNRLWEQIKVPLMAAFVADLWRAVMTLQWQANNDLFKHFLQIIEIEEQCVEQTSWTALHTPGPLLQVKKQWPTFFEGPVILRQTNLKKGIATWLQNACCNPFLSLERYFLAARVDQGDSCTFLARPGMEACTVPAAHHLRDGSRK